MTDEEHGDELEPAVLEGEIEEPLDVDEVGRQVGLILTVFALVQPAGARRFEALVRETARACEALLREAGSGSGH